MRGFPESGGWGSESQIGKKGLQLAPLFVIIVGHCYQYCDADPKFEWLMRDSEGYTNKEITMGASSFEFTPAQKAMLEEISQRTGEGIDSLIDRALANLQDEKSSMDETDYLLASPNNATHLREALEDFQNGQRNFTSHDLIEE